MIDRVVGAPGHRKYIVGGINSRDKRMLQLAMAKLLNTKIIRYYPKINFMQVY